METLSELGWRRYPARFLLASGLSSVHWPNPAGNQLTKERSLGNTIFRGRAGMDLGAIEQVMTQLGYRMGLYSISNEGPQLVFSKEKVAIIALEDKGKTYLLAISVIASVIS